MANALRMTLRSVFAPLRHDSIKLPSVLLGQSPKYLYARGTLGLDAFQAQQQYIRNQMETIWGKFREKMATYSSEDSKTMIFTEDLKNMVHLADNDEDIALVVQMVKKFNSQNKELRFGSFIFGPVVMRMFHVHNKADLALECFNSPELEGLFDQLITYQILLDLLYENKKYNEMLKVHEIVKGRQLHEIKHPRNVVVLTMAACYKLNTPEAFKYAMNLWGELRDAGHFPMRRATTFIAGLALNQGNPEAALEIVSSIIKQNYVTIRNLKVKALCDIGRLDEALIVLKSIIASDRPTDNVQHTFNRDVLESAKRAVLKADNPDISLEFNRLEKLFERQAHISHLSLDELLCSEIQQPPVMHNRQQNRYSRYQPPGGRFEPHGRRGTDTVRERPGLEDMV